MHTDRRPLIAGNWKMNLNHLEAIALVQALAWGLTAADLDAVDVLVLPPFTDLRSVQTLVEGDRLRLAYGAQDVSRHAAGAYTGDVSAAMLTKLHCTHVLVGHSERRQHHAEDDPTVAAKARMALTAGLVPVVCVGEQEEIRDAGEHEAHVVDSLRASLSGVDPGDRELVVAYEPVWAIGTGKTASPQDAEDICGALRAALGDWYGATTADRTRLLYGGSVKPDSAGDILAQPDVDGALVGGASLVAEDFLAICRAARAG